MTVKLIIYKTTWGGIKQVWQAFDRPTSRLGLGRTRQAAIADLTPAGQRHKEGRRTLPSDFHEYHTPDLPAKGKDGRRRRVPVYA